MSVNCFVDTNILVYFRDSSEIEKQIIAEKWLEAIWEKQIGRLSYQVLNEYYVTVTQKLVPGMDRESARMDVKNLMAWNPIAIEKSIVENGWVIQEQYHFSWWDALIVSAAQKANCAILLSEDLQHNQIIGNLTIINPFLSDLDQVIG
jgi:predicted nucleic acid-binding protein